MLLSSSASASASCYDCNASPYDEGRAGLGAFALVGGLTITPIGWVMFGTSFKPEVEVTPMRRSGGG